MLNRMTYELNRPRHRNARLRHTFASRTVQSVCVICPERLRSTRVANIRNYLFHPRISNERQEALF